MHGLLQSTRLSTVLLRATGGAVHMPVARAPQCGDKRKSMGVRTSKQYYAVVKGKTPGMYDSWACCERQVKGFSGNQYRGFSKWEDAAAYLQDHGVECILNGDSVDYYSKDLQLKKIEDAGEDGSIGAVVGKKNAKRKADDTMVSPHHGAPLRHARLEFDGASKRNPGPSGFGAVIFDRDTDAVVREITGYLGDHGTNNQAEYAGLVAGLHACKEMGVRDLSVKGDSKLVINQVLNTWKVKNDELRRYHRKAIDLIGTFDSFTAEHVLRAFNAHADRLSNIAIEEKNPWSLDDI